MLRTSACRTLSAVSALVETPGQTAGKRPKGPKQDLEEDLSELLPEGGWGSVLVAADLDQPLQAGLELVLVDTRGATLEVQLQLHDVGVAQLTISVPVELLHTVVAVHCWGT